ncbi:hypothetical protein GCM10009594_22730 [Kocuria palustris]
MRSTSPPARWSSQVRQPISSPTPHHGGDGFGAEIPLEQGVRHVTVEALDDNGQVLATGTPQD